MLARFTGLMSAVGSEPLLDEYIGLNASVEIRTSRNGPVSLQILLEQ
jgi:hypothetical protein